MSISKEKALRLIQNNELKALTFIEIESLCGKPDYADPEEWIYSLNISLMGMFSEELHLYFSDGRVLDQDIVRYFMNIYIGTNSSIQWCSF